MEKIYLAMWMWLCEGKLKVKTVHFRLPSASQKRACLSSLILLFLHINTRCLPFSSWFSETSKKEYRHNWGKIRLLTEPDIYIPSSTIAKYRRHTDPDVRYDQNEIKRSKGLIYFKQNCSIFWFAVQTFLRSWVENVDITGLLHLLCLCQTDVMFWLYLLKDPSRPPLFSMTSKLLI